MRTMLAGVGKYESDRRSGLASRVAKPEQVDPRPTAWCYICGEPHRYHGRAPLERGEREAIGG